MIQASMQTGHKLDKQDMVPNAREIMRTWYGTFMGHMGHELDGIQWGHLRHEIAATPMGTYHRWTSVTKWTPCWLNGAGKGKGS